jgi:SAM-dependent methyltransferase
MEYHCPRCASTLVSDASTLACDKCRLSYPIVDGIPLFNENRYWGKVPESVMEEAVATIENDGWDVFKTRFEKKLDVAFDESRADWHFEVPLRSDWNVLDAGAGLGRITVPLARAVKHVVAFDQSLVRMRFIKGRLERENLANVDLFIGDLFDAPLAPGSFDLIAMNGVLEWVGMTDRYDNGREGQLAALRKCKELLKPGGYLYIGIENRYSFVYMHGADHGGLLWTSFMPRFLARWYARMRQGASYKTYTYSKRGYENLLREAGFAKTQFFLPYPGYNLPRIIIPYDDLRALSFMLSHLTSLRAGMRWVLRVPLVLRIYRYFFFSFNIITRV